MEEIANLGQYLKNLREEKKIPAALVAQELKTRLDFIQAIENNEYQKLPAPIFVKGFLRSYAKYLGIDGDHIISEFNRANPIEDKQELVLKTKNIPGIANKYVRSIVKYAIPIIVVTVVVILSGIVLFFVLRKVTDTPPAKTSIIKEEKVIEEPVTPPKPILSEPIAGPYKLHAKATNPSWIRINSDNKLIFEGILIKNEEKTWDAKDEFRIRLGAPKNMKLTLNDHSLPDISTKSGPINVLINKEGVKLEK